MCFFRLSTKTISSLLLRFRERLLDAAQSDIIMLEFVASGIDVDSGYYKVSDCVICIFTKFISVTDGVKIGCSDYIGGSAYVITNQQMEVIRLP